jgi:hypothetical protein
MPMNAMQQRFWEPILQTPLDCPASMCTNTPGDAIAPFWCLTVRPSADCLTAKQQELGGNDPTSSQLPIRQTCGGPQAHPEPLVSHMHALAYMQTIAAQHKRLLSFAGWLALGSQRHTDWPQMHCSWPPGFSYRALT